MASLLGKPIIPVVETGTDPPRSLAGVEYIRFDRENPGPTIDTVVRFLTKLRDDWQYVEGIERASGRRRISRGDQTVRASSGTQREEDLTLCVEVARKRGSGPIPR